MKKSIFFTKERRYDKIPRNIKQMIKNKAWDKIFAKWNGANLKLNEALQHLRKLSSQFNIEDEEFENAERSVEFFGKELQIYDYLLNLIQNDRRSDEPAG